MNSRAGALADYQINPKIFHRRVENFFERRLQAVNFIEKKEIALVERSEHGGQVAFFLEQRTRAYFDRHAHLVCENLRQRGLAEARRTVKQHVIERFFAGAGGLDRDRQIFFHARLADVIVEALRAHARFQARVFVEGAPGNQPMSCIAQFHLLLTLPRNR